MTTTAAQSRDTATGATEALPLRLELPFKDAKDAVLDAFERTYLRELMGRHRENLSAAAREAQVDRKHWRSLLKKHGLHVEPEEDD